MTIDHDSDPDATVRMPRPAGPKKEADLEDVDPDSTLIREDWGNAIVPAPSATPNEPQAPTAVPPLQEWERTLRRPAYSRDQE